MNRRDFMVAASGVSGAAAVATATIPVGAQEDDGADDPDDDTAEENGNGNGNGGADEENGAENGDEDAENGNGAANGGGGTETVAVGDNYFEPEDLTIEPGTTVEWIWEGSAQHNINPTEQPDGADWEGHVELQDSGEYEHTFDVEGDYAYTCDPHPGMDGTISVTEDADAVAAEADVDIHDIGVPIQKHFVGIATFLAIFVSLVFTFYLLKYGESAHSSSPGRK
ncbi:cupredoxin domain-containing protein [Natronoglomus mannanivorans]|uniref:Plastocyanin/azurin family copper-binding protein n=1 Tax=Natronoglomus mannanivorans TaxID=2979990 RepID=A0AAP2YYB1_9EURY|nr:plastocyanin/azurin family copper-binding protein [Halobacteria archaeon AArc-xg1-1]